MVSRELLKSEIDKVRSEHLELLYGIIKLLENGVYKDKETPLEARPADGASDWHEFVAGTYGCCSDAPLSRGEQGRQESRETME
jgi:hypothetical protein